MRRWAATLVLAAALCVWPGASARSSAPNGTIVATQLLLFDAPDGCEELPCGWHKIWVGTPSGGFRKLAHLGPKKSFTDEFAPVLSPLARRVAYVTFGSRLAVAPVDLAAGRAGHPTRLRAGPDAPTAVAWSPDGTRLVLVEGFRHKGVWVIGSDGAGLHRVVRGHRIDVFAGYGVSWSARGIAFAGARGEKSAIFVVHPDGTALRRVTAPPRGTADSQPVWSPDGSEIAFVRGSAGRDQVRDPGTVSIVSLRTGDVRAIARGSAPAWSPDGRQLAFAFESDALERTRISIANLASSAVRRVPVPVGLARFGLIAALSWRPSTPPTGRRSARLAVPVQRRALGIDRSMRSTPVRALPDGGLWRVRARAGEPFCGPAAWGRG